MASTSRPNPPSKTPPPKLPRLPNHARIQKRPLLHPPIPSPYTNASQRKVVYISAKTPFISAVKRVRKLLEQIDKRALGKIDIVTTGKGKEKQRLEKLSAQVAAVAAVGSKNKEREEEVVLKATNRAIERALALGLYFQGQEDVKVRLRTGSVGVVDDIVEVERDDDDEGNEDRRMREGESEGEGREELPESRIRHASSIEVAITSK